MSDTITVPRAVLEQALEAIELHLSHHENGCVFLSDIPDALRAALEQPKPLPSTVWRFVPTTMTDAMVAVDKELRHAVPWIRWEAILAAAPQPPRQPLTDDEIERLWYQSWGGALPFARAIERIYGIGE